MSPASAAPPTLSARERDYLLVTIFVFAQHGHFERARILVDAMLATGDESAEVLLAEAILSFFCNDITLTLNCLDKLDRVAETHSFQTSDDTHRMRMYLRARCHFAAGREAEARGIASALTAKPENFAPGQK